MDAGFTVYHGSGYWQEAHEPSLIIEILMEYSSDLALESLAHEIIKVNQQEEVWITAHTVESMIIRKTGGEDMTGSEAISQFQKDAVLREYARDVRDGNIARAARILEANKHNISRAEFEAAEV